MKVAKTINRTNINLAAIDKNSLTPGEWLKVLGITTTMVVLVGTITLSILFVVQGIFFPGH